MGWASLQVQLKLKLIEAIFNQKEDESGLFIFSVMNN